MRTRATIFAVIALLGAACTHDRYGTGGDPWYDGGLYGQRGIGGTGARHLDPWLAGTRAGTVLILARFDRNYNGQIGTRRAAEANRWFRRYADTDHDLRLTDREIALGLDGVMRDIAR